MDNIGDLIIKAGCTIEDVMRDFTINDNRILFLINEKNSLVGCITDGDIRRYLLAGGKISDSALYAANKNPRVARSMLEARILFDKKNFIVIPIVDSNGEIIDLYDGDSEEKRILLIGGGGHCRSVLDSLLSLKKYNRVGIVDFENSSALGIPVVGTDDDLPQLLKDGWNDAFITVGSVGNTGNRRRLYRVVKELGFHIPIIVDPSAVVAKKVKIGEGTYVGKNAVINTGSWIGCSAIINTGALVEHDCIVGDFAHISPGAVLCGHVSVGDDSHIGAGSVVRQQISIGKNSTIGAGSVVVKDISESVVAFGNPCRKKE